MREKLVSSQRVIFALSYCHLGRSYHKLMSKAMLGYWSLDDEPLDFRASLEEVILYLCTVKHPKVACKLQPTPPAPPSVATIPKGLTLGDDHGPRVMGATRPVDGTLPSTFFLAHNWDTEQVVSWLVTLGLSRYAPAFREMNIHGRRLQLLSETTIRNLCAGNLADANTVIHAIASLRVAAPLSGEPPAPPERRPEPPPRRRLPDRPVTAVFDRSPSDDLVHPLLAMPAAGVLNEKKKSGKAKKREGGGRERKGERKREGEGERGRKREQGEAQQETPHRLLFSRARPGFFPFSILVFSSALPA